MSNNLSVSLELNNDRVQFKGYARDNDFVFMDYFPPIGDGLGYTGVELILMSFAGCSATSVIYLLRKLGKSVEGLRVTAEGERSNEPPLTLKKIVIDYTIISNDVTEYDFQKALKLSEESVSPVWSLIKNNVEVVVKHSIARTV